MATIDPIGLAKAILWEEAKGKLRALAAASGQYPSNNGHTEKWEQIDRRVEDFIKNFEEDCLHE